MPPKSTKAVAVANAARAAKAAKAARATRAARAARVASAAEVPKVARAERAGKGICLVCHKGNPACAQKVGTTFVTNLSKHVRDMVQFVLNIRKPPAEVFLCRKHQNNARRLAENLQHLFVDAGLAEIDSQTGEYKQTFLMDAMRGRFQEARAHISQKKPLKRTHVEMETATTPSLLLPNTNIAGTGTRVPTDPVYDTVDATEHRKCVTAELLRQACGQWLPKVVALSPTFMNNQLTQPQKDWMALRVASLLCKVFDQKIWHDILLAVVLRTPKVYREVTEIVCKEIAGQFDLGFSLHVRGMIKASESMWRNLFHMMHYDSDNMRRTLPNGVTLPHVLHSWDATQKLVKVFRRSSEGPRYKACVPEEPADPSRYVDFSTQAKELLGS
jgi:hypothetical protein